MTVGPRLRRTAFWALDASRGSPIRNHLNDIRSKMEGDAAPEERLEPLLDHAIRTTPFYARSAGPHIESFPVTTKQMFRSRFTEFLSSTSAGANLHYLQTSGTSGAPLTIGQSADKRRRSIADTIYFNETFGQLVGDRLLWLRAWPPQLAKPRHVRLAQNIVPFEVRGMDDGVKEAIVRTLSGRKVNAMLGYSTTLRALARFIEERGYDAHAFGLRVIINDSEAMHLTAKRRLEAVFGCSVVDRYANVENGILAATAPGDDLLTLNRASCWFEFLKLEADEPEVPGRPARVVVTDLYNYAMPIIRYDTGDLAVVADHGGRHATTLERIEGRRADVIYDTAGHQVSESVALWMMYEFHDILEYQLVQEGPSEYHLYVAGADDASRAGDFVATLQDTLGHDARISVDFVESIPRDKGGKARALVCNYVPRRSGAETEPHEVDEANG